MLSSSAITQFFVFVFFLCMIAGAVFYNSDKLFPKQHQGAANAPKRSLWFENVLTRPWFNPVVFRSLTSIRVNPLMAGSKSGMAFYGEHGPFSDRYNMKPAFDSITALKFMEMRYEFVRFDEQRKNFLLQSCRRMGITPDRWITNDFTEYSFYPTYKMRWVLGRYPVYEDNEFLHIPYAIGACLYVKAGGATLSNLADDEKNTVLRVINDRNPATFRDTIDALNLARDERLKYIIQN